MKKNILFLIHKNLLTEGDLRDKDVSRIIKRLILERKVIGTERETGGYIWVSITKKGEEWLKSNWSSD